MVAISSANILVADDAPKNVELLEQMLTQMGHRVRVAYDGQQAWRLIQRHTFDLLLLDVMMPNLTGLDVLGKVRERWDMQQLPVILLSAMSENDDVVRGLSSGANDYFTKPFSTKVARTRIHTQLELKYLADERRRALLALQHTNQIKNRLMQIAAHDLRSPLHNLGMMLRLLQLPTTDEQRRDAILDNAHGVIKDMDTTIGEFLDFGILQDDELSVQQHPVQIDACVSGAYQALFQSAYTKRITVDIDLDGVTVQADERRLKQALTNLLSNAIKYTHPGTTVTVYGAVDEQHDVYYLFVRDEGDGIPADEHDRLFQPFSKLSTQPTAGEPSTGLGLWIVKQMMDVQGGDVGLNANYTAGAEFWLRIPLAPAVMETDTQETEQVTSAYAAAG